MVPPRSNRISRVPPYSRTIRLSTRTGLSPTMACLSRQFRFLSDDHWPGPRSLATTNGVSVDVLSSGYLDVSVRRVCFVILCIQITMTLTGRVSPFGNPRIKDARISPRLIATCYVLHRLSVPRHSPNALQRLITKLSCTGTSPAHDVSAFSNLRYMNYTSYLPERVEGRIPEHAG